MTKEWKWRKADGSAFFNAGVFQQDAVGAEKPSDAIPLQEGARLLFAKGVDRIWLISLIAGVISLLTHRKRQKCRKLKRKVASIRRTF
ncbi:MAG: hypothetical protein IKG82_17285 [Oscillospiraceae bacterium]|nr:hypothetical protein [Oscillospiraceae bacterium]MBR6716753.1 hypothetical protein [Oscillospiraceae bacterium]